MAISSAGVGSGLNVQSIVSQLVAVESQPVRLLQAKGSVLQTKISAFAGIKSDLSALQDAALALKTASTWDSKTFASSSASTVTGTATSAAMASTFALTVEDLANGQSVKSAAFPSTFKASTGGTLSIQLGSWNANGSFANASSPAVSVSVAVNDSLSDIAAKINAKSTTAGVNATVVTANGSQQLLLRSTSTGLASAFQITPSTSALSQFGYQAFKQPFAAPANSTLSIQLGTLDSGGVFTPGSASIPVDVVVGDSMSVIQGKINAQTGTTGVTASVVTATDGTQQLQLTDSSGSVAFRAMDAGTSTDYPFSQVWGMSGTLSRTQTAKDAAFTIEGVSATSATNTVANVVSGVTLNLLAKNTSPTLVTVGADKEAMKAKIQALQDAYNKLNADLKTQTKYDATNRTGGPLLGDSTVTGLQSMLRSILVTSVPTSVSSISSLSKLGLAVQPDGSLKTDISSVEMALQNPADVKAFFGNSDTDKSKHGIAKRIYDFVFGANAVDGAVSSHSSGFQKQVEQNNATIDKFNTHIAAYQKQLLSQYNTLDANMAKLNSLSSYVAQQITTWNKSG